MPEGPEVTIMTEAINNLLKNAEIISWEFNDKSRYKKKAPDGYLDFNIDLTNENKHVRVKEIKNKSKFMYWRFTNGTVLFQTLGLSGGWYKKPQSNSGLIITFLRDDENKEQKLYFDDQRRFGTLKFFDSTNSNKELEKKLKTIGPDILNDEKLVFADYLKIMRQKRVENRIIANVLMDQKLISGVGNYLRSEILYASKINPHREVKSLSDDELKKIYENSRKLIYQSYRDGGVSVRHYSDVNQIKGKFELKVYGMRKTKDDAEIKHEKIGKETQNTYWVPTEQN
jgi:DNA-formamidopyrimidine glycosylase